MTRALVVVLLFAWCVPGWTEEEDVGAAKAAVLEYLRDLGGEEVAVGEVLKRSVLSSFLGEKRRKVVEDRLTILREDWIERGMSGEAMEVKLDGDFGVVLVAMRSGRDPLSIEVLGWGLQRKKEEWRPTPLPGGFEAVFLGFDEEVELRVAELERWMSGEKARLRESLATRARDEFEAALQAAAPEVLAGEDPEAVVRVFLEACRERDFLPALACLGEMKKEPDQNWLESKSVMGKGLQNQDSRNQWRLLTDPAVLPFISEVERDNGDASVRVLVYDPRNSGAAVSDLGFDLLRKGKRWNLVLPPELRFADVSERRYRNLIRMGRDDEAENLFEVFRGLFEERHDSVAAGDLAEAGELLRAALRSGSLVEVFRMVSREAALSEAERVILYRKAGTLWMNFRDEGGAQDPKLVGSAEHGQAGVLAVARLDATRLNWVQLIPVQFLKTGKRWLIAPGVTGPGNFDEGPGSLKKDQQAVEEDFEDKEEEFRAAALPSLMDSVAGVGDLSLPAVEGKKALELVREFRSLLRENKPLEAIKLCALVDPRNGIWEGMRTMTYSARGARQAPEADDYLQVKSAGPWTAVSVRVSAPSFSIPHYPMYLVGPSEDGPRLIVDLDLRLATNKGRSLLNEASLERLGKELEARHLELVETLFQGHVGRAQEHYEEWQKSTKSSP